MRGIALYVGIPIVLTILGFLWNELNNAKITEKYWSSSMAISMNPNTSQRMVFPTNNRMLLSADPCIEHIIQDNKVYKLCRIVCIIPNNHFFEKITQEQIYDFFILDEKGVWLVEHVLNNIIVEQVVRHDVFDTKIYAHGRVLEKDYTFYMLKWGQ